ncbi:interferon regulatory factor 3 isoform X1 [Monodelphis domestica]|uniref:Interferon regulatory factor 3 n=1 Tax=Monodelphis domestica TaxID=13616 RepID=F6VVK5_MONDO|nr:interferon regulatory factor 3 isoform X1 [Monodelphis domestica]XP_007492711.1 interferon regulatory factor 3 isoform X1 [Monodelphis domestica]XP_056652767.1 interferon regulatory factor 3 isoform X1 [Monodelphis domestica]
MAKSKPRILPWLREQLDSGHLGATWINSERTRFIIPWKHGLRQDLQREDFGIFQAWAEASGSYRPGIDEPDPATWKRNFRAALDRKRNLRVVSNHSKEQHKPHKIYEFLSMDGEGFDADPDTEDGWDDPARSQEEHIQEVLGTLTLSPAGQQLFQEQLPRALGPGLHSNPLMPVFAGGLQSEYEVTAFYRGRQVLATCLACLQGLRVVGPGPVAEAWPELDGTPLALPEPSSALTDQRAAHYVSKVLGSLGAGLALWSLQNELRAQRLGHCKVHWALGEQASPGAPGREVTKERDGQQVCDIPKFVNELISFLEGSHRSPQYTLWFCLGESWPTDSQPWTKKLVMVKVVPTALKALHEVAQAEGASSLKEEEIDLHISSSLSLSLAPAHLHGYLQELAHSMEWESGVQG